MSVPQPLAVVPTLDELAGDPARLDALPRIAVADLYARVARLEAALRARLLAAAPDMTRAPAGADDRVLAIDEAAAMLGMSRDFLYRHWSRLHLGYKDVDGHVKFLLSRVQRYIRTRAG